MARFSSFQCILLSSQVFSGVLWGPLTTFLLLLWHALGLIYVAQLSDKCSLQIAIRATSLKHTATLQCRTCKLQYSVSAASAGNWISCMACMRRIPPSLCLLLLTTDGSSGWLTDTVPSGETALNAQWHSQQPTVSNKWLSGSDACFLLCVGELFTHNTRTPHITRSHTCVVYGKVFIYSVHSGLARMCCTFCSCMQTAYWQTQNNHTGVVKHYMGPEHLKLHFAVGLDILSFLYLQCTASKL